MAKKLWGGRFGKKTNPMVEEFTKSIGYDYRLAGCDIIGSIAHVQILEKAAFVSSQEAQKLIGALKKIYGEIKNGKFKFDETSEDIHTNMQNAVEKEVGDLALKLHTARSRNDQVLFDLKLFCKFELQNVQYLCLALKKTLQKCAKDTKDVIIPGYTHLQPAHLVYLGDYLAGFGVMLGNDNERLENIKKNIKLIMGAGALAGTPIEAKLYSKKLEDILEEAEGITIEPPVNSLHTVSDRDFVIDILAALSIIGMHLSRLSEDLIIWSTKEFSFVELDDAFATGSSLMPHKKNPDVLELIRGYTSVLYGNLVSGLTMMKGLPLTYNRDMQLDKPPLFKSFEIVTKELNILAKLVETLKWNKDTIKKRLEKDESIYATDILYHLVKKGIPFKKAHDIVGRLVKYSIDTNKAIKDMKDKELKPFSEKLKQSDMLKLMKPSVSVKSRVSIKR